MMNQKHGEESLRDKEAKSRARGRGAAGVVVLGSRIMQLISFGLMAYMAVSYTHLDVYKRQLLPQGGEHLEADAGMVLYYDENTYVKFGVTQNQVFIAEYVDDRYVRQERMDFSFEGKADFSVETIGLKRKFYFNHQLLWTWDRVTSICSEGLVKGKRFTGAMDGVYVNGSNLLRWRQHSKV